MGSSGAGKSTLLNCLSGRVSTGLHGEVTLNGVPITPQLCKEFSCFVQQEDLLFGYLTVEEHLFFQVNSERNLELTTRNSIRSTCQPILRRNAVTGPGFIVIGLCETVWYTGHELSGSHPTTAACGYLPTHPPVASISPSLKLSCATGLPAAA